MYLISTTTNHPFYVVDEGWVAAGDLSIGDNVYCLDGSVTEVTSYWLEVFTEPIVVYNLEIADFHTYFVGEFGVLVHNQYTEAEPKPHGNSLDSPKTNYEYALVDKDTNEILKFGETMHKDKRYSKSFLEEINAVIKILVEGTKRDIHYWQYDMNNYYYSKYGAFPPFVKSPSGF